MKKVVDKIDSVYYSEMVRRIIGYMVTWTTYGTWVQGEKKGYVKNGKTWPGSKMADFG